VDNTSAIRYVETARALARVKAAQEQAAREKAEPFCDPEGDAGPKCPDQENPDD